MDITSEGPTKITKATIDAAWRRRAKDNRLIIRDKDCRGLALIVNPTSMTWSYAYRPRGADPVTKRRWPNRSITLGNPASLSPDDARTEANRIKGQAASGADPVAERKARAAAEQLKRGSTLKRLLADYERALPKRPKLRGTGKPSPDYVQEELAQVRMALDDMKAVDKPAADLTTTDVRAMLDGAEGTTTARHRFSALSRFCDWLQERGHIKANPCAEIPRSRRPRAPQARDHYLTLPELARLWHAAEKLRHPVWRDLARFLIAVPPRRSEAAEMKWPHVDLGSAEWRQPGQTTKNGDPHRLYLHPLALQVLEVRRHAAAEAQADGDPAKLARILATGQSRSGVVFPAPLSGRPVDTFSDLKAALMEATKPEGGEEGEPLTGWTWHDFRRSFATALGEHGIDEAVADAALNHRQSATRGGVLGVYQRAVRWPEQKRALELWGRLLAAAIEGREAGAEVVQLHSAAG
jgi:integrase